MMATGHVAAADESHVLCWVCHALRTPKVTPMGLLNAEMRRLSPFVWAALADVTGC